MRALFLPATDDAPRLVDVAYTLDYLPGVGAKSIAKNKAWGPATEIRREWLAAYFGREASRSDLATVEWVTEQIVRRDLTEGGSLVEAWVKVPTSWRAKPLTGATLARLDQIQHAIACAAREVQLHAKDGWRSWAGGHDERSRIYYLRHLERLGYPLSPVERLAAGYTLRKGETL